MILIQNTHSKWTCTDTTCNKN